MQHNITADLRFSIIPEWLIDADVSDRAIRLYAILARYADNETLQAFPSRETLAKRAHCHWRSIDRAIDELVTLGAITKQHRRNGESYQSNIYTLRRVGPQVSLPTDTTDKGVLTPQSLPTDTDGNLTITTELEPKELYLEEEAKAKKASQIPSDFAPSGLEDFASKYPGLDFHDTLEAFRDHHTAKGSVFKDWDAAFRTWCRNAVRFQAPKTVIHKQEVKPPAQGPGYREWVKGLHDLGEHWECRPGEFGCK